MGVNTLRLYNVNPSNLLAYERYAGQYYITNPGKNHVPFLDACAKYGIKVRTRPLSSLHNSRAYCATLRRIGTSLACDWIYCVVAYVCRAQESHRGLQVIWPLFADYNYLNEFPMERLQFYMRVMVEEVGNHSALLMYAVGNELNYVNNSDYNSWVKTLGIASSLMNYARDYQRTYWKCVLCPHTARQACVCLCVCVSASLSEQFAHFAAPQSLDPVHDGHRRQQQLLRLARRPPARRRLHA